MGWTKRYLPVPVPISIACFMYVRHVNESRSEISLPGRFTSSTGPSEACHPDRG